jgi:hypothetical protein
MPPLTFDSSSPEPPPDPDPAGILLVRETAPLPELYFHGRVEPSAEEASDYVPPQPQRAEPPQQVVPAKVAVAAGRPKRSNIFARIFGVFRRHKVPCVGTGCGTSGS